MNTSFRLIYSKSSFSEVFNFKVSIKKYDFISQVKSGEQIYNESYGINGFLTVSRHYMILGRDDDVKVPIIPIELKDERKGHANQPS